MLPVVSWKIAVELVHAIPSNNIFAVSQSVVPIFCPSSETPCTFPDLSVLGVTLCALFCVCLPWPFDLHILKNAPHCHTCDTSPLVLYIPLSCDFLHIFDIWIAHYYQTAFLLHWLMLLPWCWMLVHLLVMLHKTNLWQHILLACDAFLVVGASALLAFCLLPKVYLPVPLFTIYMIFTCWNYP